MTPELQKYYEERLGMMSSIGWKQLMEDIHKMRDAINRLDSVTVDTLQFKQGELSIMNWMLSLEDVSEQSYEDLKHESDV